MNYAALPMMDFLVAASLVTCAITLIGCFLLVPRLRFRPDKLLVGVIGVLCFSHCLRLLQDTGFWPAPVLRWVPIAGFCTAVLFLMALVILVLYTTEHRLVKYRLRLAEANQVTPPPEKGPRRGSGIYTPIPGTIPRPPSIAPAASQSGQ